ncbi:MAG: UDP-N-acetylmuramate--L-alanine ligase [Candidatus Brocadiales bacterium]
MPRLVSSNNVVKGTLNSLKECKVYLVGIGGTGMSALARMLIEGGYSVYGSDIQLTPTIFALEERGASITLKQDGSWIRPDTALVIASAAVGGDNEDLRVARERGIKVVKYSHALGMLMDGRLGVAVSGTHGKTTTTAIITTIMKEAGLDPSFVIGGEVPELGGSSSLGDGEYFVVEACEYDRSFLNLSPHISVITNIEEEHFDYYHGMDELTEAFAEFASKVPREGLLVVSGDDDNVRRAVEHASARVETCSIGSPAHWTATPPAMEGGKNKFQVFHWGRYFGDFSLKIPGRHNVMNALAAIAVCHHAGVSKDTIQEALSNFAGVKRRFQVLSTIDHITVVDDYGHHPTEISVTLQAAKEFFPGRRLWCAFQPHQYSRTRTMLKGLARAFEKADRTVFTDIYPARDSLKDMGSVSSMDLLLEARGAGVKALYVPDLDKVAREICSRLRPGDVVMTMGAGNVWQAGVELVSILKDEYNGKGSNWRRLQV